MATSMLAVTLPCDTMEVGENKLITIHPGTLLHFGKNAGLDCIIRVRGQLLARGSQALPVVFAGNATESVLGPIPDKGKWSGFVVDSLGSVNFKHVNVFRASTPFTFLGQNSVLDSIRFFGCYGIILPEARNYALDPKGEFFPSFDILNPPPRREEKRGHLAEPSSSSSPWLWGAVAIAGLLVALGAAVLFTGGLGGF